MLSSRLILCAIPAGVAAGVLAWFAAGGASATAARLDPIQVKVSGLRTPRQGTVGAALDPAPPLASTPLFVMTTGPGAVVEPDLRLDGIVRTSRRIAALLSINGKPAEWLAQGEARDGVTVLSVGGSRILVETALGSRDVELGARPAASAAAATPAPEPAALDQIPPGFRSPPPPASAPRLP